MPLPPILNSIGFTSQSRVIIYQVAAAMGTIIDFRIELLFTIPTIALNIFFHIRHIDFFVLSTPAAGLNCEAMQAAPVRLLANFPHPYNFSYGEITRFYMLFPGVWRQWLIGDFDLKRLFTTVPGAKHLFFTLDSGCFTRIDLDFIYKYWVEGGGVAVHHFFFNQKIINMQPITKKVVKQMREAYDQNIRIPSTQKLKKKFPERDWIEEVSSTWVSRKELDALLTANKANGLRIYYGCHPTSTSHDTRKDCLGLHNLIFVATIDVVNPDNPKTETSDDQLRDDEAPARYTSVGMYSSDGDSYEGMAGEFTPLCPPNCPPPPPTNG